MSKASVCDCAAQSKIREGALLAIGRIRMQYGQQIGRLNGIISTKQASIQSLQQSLLETQRKTAQERKEWQAEKILLTSALQGYQAQLSECERVREEEERRAQDMRKQLQDKEYEVNELVKQLNFDAFSQSVSSISKRERSNNKTYSFDLAEYFQSYPETTLKLLNSLPHELPQDEKEVGDMTCMFISRDQLSAEKYITINRNFLKRKIKAEEKRFRIVIIYKPDKK